eukprot:TRINITY_DN50132_c0_g1_i1.p1 TRINITY_DN50132_c0_g1~~TRINITY_DN50132_c0_g1_i1.p1  ORF type:complete len:1060 (-),score=182.38 TRINITY_DN50132_c0_g1_i1:597-3776(-)
MAELMAAFGAFGKEVFDYNRENYQFDKGQQLERDLMRLKLQVKRFELFREDIRDLVELTVGKMEMYHLVGALFCEFCITFYVEGRVGEAGMPVFALGQYYLSLAGAFGYLILAVWLSMHASISSHSFGVRLLTRYVRLPIPSAQQIINMNAQLANFEREGRSAVRLPFIQQGQQWRGDASSSDSRALAALQSGPAAAGASSSSSAAANVPDHLGQGEVPFMGGEEGFVKAATRGMAGEHVQLFRRLQAKWQCYDAYARVCMSLGTNQILQSVSFYLINVMMVDFRTPTAAYALIIVMQSLALCLAFLDVTDVRKEVVLLVQATGALPCVFAAISLTFCELNADGRIKEGQKFGPLACLSFFAMVAWYECLLRVAWPSSDQATLPRRFRTVLFLDVFSDLANDPTAIDDYEDGDAPAAKKGSSAGRKTAVPAEKATEADDKCWLAHECIRRWETLPRIPAFDKQQSQLKRLRRELKVWRGALNAEAKRQAFLHRDMSAEEQEQWHEAIREDDRGYMELSAEEQREDTFYGRPVGPLDTNDGRGSYYYHPDKSEFVWEITAQHPVLTLNDVQAYVKDARESVKSILGPGGIPRHELEQEDDADEAESDDTGDEWETQKTCCGKGVRYSEDGPYIPQRLPWKVVHMTTRVIQVAWIAMGVMGLLQEIGVYGADNMGAAVIEDESEFKPQFREFPINLASVDENVSRVAQPPGGRRTKAVSCASGSRRYWFNSSLHKDLVLDLDLLSLGEDDSWLQGLLGCRGAAEGRQMSMIFSRAAQELLEVSMGVASLPLSRGLGAALPAEAEAEMSGAAKTRQAVISSVRRHAVNDAVSALFCPLNNDHFEDAGCITGSLRGQRLWLQTWKPALRRSAEALTRELRIEGPSDWQLVAGTHAACAVVTELLAEDAATLSDSRCMLLVGLGVDRHLHVAALPLSGSTLLPVEGAAVIPMFRMPLSRSADQLPATVVGLHVDGDGRLWAAFGDGRLAAWQVLQNPRFLGEFHARRPADMDSFDFEIVGMCSEFLGAQGMRLVVAGRGFVGQSGLQILRVPVPLIEERGVCSK